MFIFLLRFLQNNWRGILCVCFVSFFCVQVFAQRAKKPKIGVVLSGGGAKGLAHVGVLEVIDDIGLKVDFVTGTSMGSIIGALYATGYSGDSIHKIASSEKWDLLLSNKIPLEALTPDERLEYDKYIVEVYFENRKVKIPTGLIDGQLMNLELTYLTNPVCDKKDFSEFPIPFKCMGTNIGTGKLVVLDSGNIVEAMRASMAIPSVFTPVWYNDMLLVDGGVVHNFPVSDAIAMGATIIIGVNVSAGILPPEKLTSIPSILLQTVFIAENNDFQKQRSLTDYLIEPDLAKYSAADFDMGDSIMAAGRREGEKYRAVLQALKDSLEKKYPGEYTRTLKPPKEKFYYFTDIKVQGLKKHTEAFVKGRLNLQLHKPYSAKELNSAMEDLYGTRYFRRIDYELHPNPDTAHNKLIIHVKEESSYAAKFAINYNSLFQSGIILNFTVRNLLMKDSKLITTVNVGDNFRAKVSYGKYFGIHQASQVSIIGMADQYNLPILLPDISHTQVSDLYKFSSFVAKFNLQKQFKKRWAINGGLSAEYYKLKNKVAESSSFGNVTSSCYSAYIGAKYNTQNKVHYPTHGWKVSLNASYMFDYRFTFRDLDGTPVYFDEVANDVLNQVIKKDFQQVSFSASYLTPVAKRTTITYLLNGGLTFNTYLTFSHFYRMGGLRENFWHNVPFVGLKEFGTRQPVLELNNAVTFQLGVQQLLFKNLYCIPRGSAGTVSAQAKDLTLKTDDPSSFLYGYGITLAYHSFLGPLEFTLMHSNQFTDLQFYLNLGYNFYNQ